MYRINDLIEAFSSLVGWRDSDILTRSESGLYFEEAHPLLTKRAMKAIMPKTRIETYDSTKTYGEGALVSVADKGYKSLVSNNTSPLSSASWKPFDLVDGYLDELTKCGIKKVLTRFISEKIVGLETKNIVDRRTLFDGAGRKEARIRNKGRLVGFEFTPLRDNGITTTIGKVGVQFVGNTGTVTLYLFHSSCSDPIATKEINYTSPNASFMWFDLNEWVMPYVSERTNAGGSWYVVYDESELAPYMESINFGRDWSREPCGTCNKGDVQLFRLMNKYITISPFYVATKNWDGKLWDIDANQYTYGENYGLNFMVTMACDVTDTLIGEKALFAHAIQLQVASDALKALAMNPEVSVNRVQFNAERNDILFEVSGNGQGVKGLQGELDLAFKALSIDLKGLDPICLGCHNKGVRYTSI